MIDVLSTGLGDLGWILEITYLTPCSPIILKGEFFYFSGSLQWISLWGCHLSTSLEMLLSSLSYLSSPTCATGYLHQSNPEVPVQMVYLTLRFFFLSSHYKWWFNCLKGIVHLEQCALVRFVIWDLAHWGVILQGFHIQHHAGKNSDETRVTCGISAP